MITSTNAANFKTVLFTLKSFIFSRHWPFALFGLVFLLVLIGYLLPVASQQTRSFFTTYIADSLMLGIILVSLVAQWKREKEQVLALFWLLMAFAVLSWLLVSLLLGTSLNLLQVSNPVIVKNIGYFLFYALMIAAVEMRSYQSAHQLLTQHSLLIWVATLSFTLGSFSYLVLVPLSQNGVASDIWPNAFVFYVFMDLYLGCRWAFLAYQSRKTHWKGYTFAALAMFNWALIDSLELANLLQLISLNFGTLQDLLWFTPYLLLFIGLNMPLGEVNSHQPSRGFSRMSLLNSPLAFASLALLLHTFSQSQDWLEHLQRPSQINMFIGWVAITMLLAVAQLMLLLKQTQQLRFSLQESRFRSDTLQQQLQQQTQYLQQQADTYRSILESTSNAIFTLDDDGNILTANPAASKMLGYPDSQLIGRNFTELVSEGDELALLFSYQSYRQKLLRQAQGLELEANMVTQSGDLLAVHASVSKSVKGGASPMVISLADIREQKQAEQEILKLKDQFTANISHEFRTPLTIINGVLDNLSKAASDDQAAQIMTAKTNGLRMIRMVEQLLELSRSAQESIPVAAINAGHIIHFICQSFGPIAEEKNIQFQYPEKSSVWIMGNHQALEKVIFNLLSNAFKYTPEGGQVELKQQIIEGKLNIQVHDSGVGIPESEQKKVFHRFYRTADASTRHVHGVGIGLALVKELCSRMDWEITLTSQPGLGTQFTVVAEECAAPAETSEPIEATSQPLQPSIQSELIDTKAAQIQSVTSKSRYLVLAVEDNSDMQNHLSQMISPHHQCLIAADGEEGLRMALDYIPDIIISDVMMPGMDGFEMLKALRRNELTAHIPVIMLTARVDAESRIEGLEAEADDYLTKPFDGRELLLRVTNQIKSRVKLQQKLTRQWHFSMSKEGKQESVSVEDKFIQKLNGVFQKHFGDPEVPMSFIASELAMSERQLQRKVKALLGVSPLEALRQFRLEQAKELLQQQQQVGLTAQACGFSSQSHFGRCFKEYVGIPPREYQKQFSTSQ